VTVDTDTLRTESELNMTIGKGLNPVFDAKVPKTPHFVLTEVPQTAFEGLH
jgi:hypothetical protein